MSIKTGKNIFNLAPPFMGGATKMLPFDTAPLALSDFVIGDNDEIISTIIQLTEGALGETSVYLWGAPGSGKSHLLRAACLKAKRASIGAYFVSPQREAIDNGNSVIPPSLPGLLAVDDIGILSSSAQMDLFNWHTASRPGKYLLAAGETAPGELPLRKELTTRLAGGLVFRLRPLGDDDKNRALAACAARRGFNLPEEVSALLLSRLPRNMNSLIAALDDLDSFLLAQQKPLTPRRVHAWLRQKTTAA